MMQDPVHRLPELIDDDVVHDEPEDESWSSFDDWLIEYAAENQLQPHHIIEALEDYVARREVPSNEDD